jgi:hypothetical protein
MGAARSGTEHTSRVSVGREGGIGRIRIHQARPGSDCQAQVARHEMSISIIETITGREVGSVMGFRELQAILHRCCSRCSRCSRRAVVRPLFAKS